MLTDRGNGKKRPVCTLKHALVEVELPCVKASVSASPLGTHDSAGELFNIMVCETVSHCCHGGINASILPLASVIW